MRDIAYERSLNHNGSLESFTTNENRLNHNFFEEIMITNVRLIRLNIKEMRIYNIKKHNKK